MRAITLLYVMEICHVCWVEWDIYEICYMILRMYIIINVNNEFTYIITFILERGASFSLLVIYYIKYMHANNI